MYISTSVANQFYYRQTTEMSFLRDRFALLKSVLMYLDFKKQFMDIKENAIKYRHLKESFIYSFSVNVDLGFIFEQDAVLGTTILSLPLESANFFQEVIFQFCLSHDLLPSNTTPSQICVRLRINNFPSNCHSSQITKMPDLIKHLNYRGFVKLVGIAAGVSGLAKYTNNFMCALCGEILEEVKSMRILSG
ncbi:unnamed protein product [Candidula unifasciata]|uniref:MCMDC2 N-terminal domain-containing protein n=1 Tax=Candidula unifasciata TaxID=100452 RepID=A0A8S3ZT23_9EUPU|nr:unnamed protein product [Candidula unifasciata]